MTVSLAADTTAYIQRDTGLTCDQIVSMDVDELTQAIERKIGKKLKFKKSRDPRLMSRGSVYLFLNRFLNFDTEKMNRRIDALK